MDNPFSRDKFMTTFDRYAAITIFILSILLILVLIGYVLLVNRLDVAACAGNSTCLFNLYIA